MTDFPNQIGIKFTPWPDGGQLLTPCMVGEEESIPYLRCDIAPADAVVVSRKWCDDLGNQEQQDEATILSLHARIAELEARKHELRAMLDEMILSVQGENVYLCDEVWATADRLLAQLKE